MASSQKSKPTDEDYQKLGRVVESALIVDYVELLGDTRRQMRLSFFRGIAMGFGSVIGATVVVALIVWLLHVFGGLPVIGHFLTDTGKTFQK